MTEKEFIVFFLKTLTEVRQNKKKFKNDKGKLYDVTARQLELISYLFYRALEGDKLDFKNQLEIANDFERDVGSRDVDRPMSKITVSRCLNVFYAYDILSMKDKDDASDEDDSPVYVRPLKIRFNYGKYGKGYYAEG